MKKLVFFALIPMILLLIFTNGTNDEAVQKEEEYQVIPDEAIRLRILANSDHDTDQEVKNVIRNEVSDQVSEWVEDLTSIEDARQLIKSRIPEIMKTAEEVLARENSTDSVEVDYGENITFPLKMYDKYIYPPGEYEAILITIGEGKGANWWCVLFPPLCFLDFSDGSLVADSNDGTENDAQVVEEQTEEPVKIKFFLFEWFGWT